MTIKLLTEFGHCELSGGPLDEPDAKIFFQQADPAAQTRTR
jgi:hypothetical protein